MSKLIRRKKEIGAALAVALQLMTLTLIGVIGHFVAGTQQATKAPAASQTTGPTQAQPVTNPANPANDLSGRRASAVRAVKLYEPRASQVFNLATSRAESAESTRQTSQQSSQHPDIPNEATLTTDREDYAPYSYVYINGTGFQPGETVNMIVVELDPVQQSFEPWDVVADENGNIQTSWYIFTSELIGATMQVTATGQTSGLTGSATFTDAINVSFYENLARTIGRDAFAWGNTVFAAVSGQVSSKCYRIQWLNPSGTVVQTTDFPPPNSGNINDSFNIPASGPSGIWTVNVYDGPGGGACTFSTPAVTRTFDVAKAVIIGAVADNYVDLTAPTTVESPTGTTLIVDHKNTTDEKRTFLRFDLSGIAAPIDSATLRMTNFNEGNQATTQTHDVYRVTTNWADASITWNNQPSVAGTATSSQAVTGPAPSLMRWTVTSDVAGFVGGTFTNFGWRVSVAAASNSGNTAVSYGSTERNTPTDKTQAAVLLVDYGVPITPTPTPSASASPTPTPTPTPSPTPTATPAGTNLTVAAASGTYGGTVILSATLTSNSSPVSGKTITFTLNGNAAGTGVTNASGIATSSSVTLCGSSYNVSGSPYGAGAAASFAGDLSFGGSNGSSSLTVTKANATVVVAPYDVPYDGNNHTATVTSITGVCGETGAAVGSVDVSGTIHVSAAGSPYSDTWSFAGTGNYNNIAAGPATTIIDKINKINATWTTNPASKTYGDTDPSPLTTGSGSGFISADAALLTVSYSRAVGETVLGGPYHITATLGPADVVANYNITNAGANFTINTRSATWTTNPASKTYGDADPSPLTTGSGSNFVAADNVTATYSRDAGETVLGGPYHITATLSPAGVLSNYSITNAGANFTINTRAATWTTNPASKTYGDADPSPLTTGSGSNFVAADNVTASYGRAPGETVLGGPYHITATLSPAGVLSNYTITNAGADFTISTRAATWTTNPASKTYGDVDPSPLTTGSGSGFVAADNVTASYSRVAGESVANNPYHISATLSPAGVLSNYTITNNGADFAINKRNATWTTNPASKTYGDADPSPLTTGSGSNFTDPVSATYSRATGESVVGSPYHITATLSAGPGVLANYNITNDGADFTINKRNATWTTNPASKTYGDADPSPLTTGSGSNFTDPVSATYNRAIGESVAGSPYHITATLSAGPGVLANYNITNDGADFTINKRNATWTTDPASKTYGDADPSPLTTGNGSNFTDPVSATYSRATGESVVGSPYHITATLSAAPGVLANYNITNNGADFTINKRNATWTTDPNSKTYGDLDPNPLTTGSGSNFADPVSATYSRAAGESVAGGPYHITATLSAGSGVLDNYNITNTGADFTINKRNATWTTVAATKTYGDTDPVPLTTGSGTNFIDPLSATYSRAPGESVANSPYHITATLGAAPGVLDNYNITNAGADFTVTKRDATWTTVAASKTYGDADPVPLTTGSGSNFVDSVSATYSRASGETVLGGPYHITATLSAGAGVLDNYNITNNGADFTISTRSATWTTNSASKTYGDADPVPLTTGSGSNFVAADNVTASYSRAAGETVLGGPYHITATLSPAGALSNYTITNTGASFTINTRSATWTTNPAGKTYGDADPTPLTTGSGSNFVATDNVTASYARATGETVLGGPYHITATLSPAGVLSNYTITNAGADFTISTRAAIWTTNPNSKTYGNPDPTPLTTGSGSNFVAADNVTASYSRAAGETVLGGPYHINATLSPAGVLSNYTITNNGANFTINPATLTITATNRSKVFGALYTPNTTPPSVDFTVTGLVSGDSVTSVTLTCAGYAAAALPQSTPYTVTPSAAVGTGLTNYTIGYMNGQFTIGYGTCTNGTPGHQILPPINADGSSVWKVGSTVPVKFTLCDANGNPISNASAVFATGYGSIQLINTVRGTVNGVNEETYADIPDSAFRWSGGIWIFNMATSNLQKNTTYTFRINLADGSYIQFSAGTK